MSAADAPRRRGGCSAAVLAAAFAAAASGAPTTAAAAAVADAQIAPDGRTVAFTLAPASAPSGESSGRAILAVPFAGGEPRRLTAEGVDAAEPRWSPDGGRIAFLCRRDAARRHAGLCVMRSSGEDARTVADPGNGIRAFAWSPDGRRIAYLAADSGQDAVPATIVVADEGPPAAGEPSPAAAGFGWSPAGPPRELARSASLGSGPLWSPDGTTTAWLERAAGDEAAPARVMVAVAGKAPAVGVAGGEASVPRHLSWSGDGRLSVAVAEGEALRLVLLDVRTGARTAVLPPGIVAPTGPPSWSADGRRYAVCGATAAHGPEIFAGSLPPPIPPGPDWVGAPPPPVRRITFFDR